MLHSTVISRIYMLIYEAMHINIKDFPKERYNTYAKSRNRVIRICIQNAPVPPIAGYF